MPVRILVVADSTFLLSAVRRVLQMESRIKIVGEACAFTAMMQLIVDTKPEVLLFDLYMAERRRIGTAFVKSQLRPVNHVRAMSLANDTKSEALAESFGVTLLDKMHLVTELIPAVLRYRSKNPDLDAPPHKPLTLKRSAQSA